MTQPGYYWVGFNLVKGIGAVRMRALLDYFGDAETAWQASSDTLRQAGLSAKMVEALTKIRQGPTLEQTWETIQKSAFNVLTWEDDRYPQRLLEIEQPPPVLYTRGEVTPADEWAIAIVGTRRISPYGRQVTEQMAGDLAGKGLTIVSGMARGVDAVAHIASLNANGRTLAVLGSGVDQIYPPEHRKLAMQIAEHGALLSDYPPGTPPEATNFPPRNRIISGLSRAVIVTEAGENSGALITAAFASQQGREIFAVPGSILAPQSKGTNLLIQQGARPLLTPQDILDVMNLRHFDQQREARSVIPTDATEAQILGTLTSEPQHVDEIRLQTGLPIEKVSATLTMMELKGMVRQVGGMQYVTVREAVEVYRTE